MPSQRRSVTNLVFGLVVVLLIAGVLSATYFAGSNASTVTPTSPSASSASQSTTKTSSSSSSSQESGPYIITDLHTDVVSPDDQESLYSNLSSIAGRMPFVYLPGETFTVEYNIVFQACACNPQVLSVNSMTSGFVVVSTDPPLPVPFGGSGGDFYTASFNVEVTAPSTPYTGTLTLVAHVE